MRPNEIVVVDPTLSAVRITESFISAGFRVVLYCDYATSAIDKLSENMEMRKFEMSGGEIFCHADCVVDLIGSVEEKVKFYNRVPFPEGPRAFLCDIPFALWDNVLSQIHGTATDKLIAVRFPMFPSKRRMVIECIVDSERSTSAIDALSSLCKDKIKLLTYCDKEEELFDRIGLFWAAACVVASYECGLDIEVADSIVANEYTGDSSGVFGLLDNMGLDHFINALSRVCQAFPDDCQLLHMRAKLPVVISHMISDELTGRACGRGGFYRTYDMLYGKIGQALDMRTGLYRRKKEGGALQEAVLAERGDFLRSISRDFFSYIEFVSQQYTTNIKHKVDDILKEGYGWKYGLRELADKLGIGFIHREEGRI